MVAICKQATELPSLLAFNANSVNYVSSLRCFFLLIAYSLCPFYNPSHWKWYLKTKSILIVCTLGSRALQIPQAEYTKKVNVFPYQVNKHLSDHTIKFSGLHKLSIGTGSTLFYIIYFPPTREERMGSKEIFREVLLTEQKKGVVVEF